MPNKFPVLDACCGSRMFWFDKTHKHTLFMDNRMENHEFKDRSTKSGKRVLIVDPDLQADFTSLPFSNNSFSLVVFDPPHLVHAGKKSWLAKKYGKLNKNWQEEISSGFKECFRVLKKHGVLVIKWSEIDIPVSKIIGLSPIKPLIGHRSGKHMKTHWLLFMG